MQIFKIFPDQIGAAFSKAYLNAEKKYTKACIETVNIQAAKTRQNAQAQVQQNFTLRNNFTQNSILYTSCPLSTKRLEDVQSEVGATTRADYLDRQEKGGEHKGVNGNALAIPTLTARGGTNSSVIRKKYNLRNMQVVNYGGGRDYTSRSSHLVAMAYIGFKSFKLVSYKSGIFEIRNFKKNGQNINFEMKLIRNKKFKITHTNPSPWLQPSAEGPARDCQQIFNIQMAKQG